MLILLIQWWSWKMTHVYIRDNGKITLLSPIFLIKLHPEEDCTLWKYFGTIIQG